MDTIGSPNPYCRTGDDLFDPVHRRPALHGDLQADRPLLCDRPLEPGNPKILGKLKIPGYSDYLHPYDATHIIGIGKETTTNEWGGVSTSGVKLALFDVTDVANPKQLDKVQIGDAGSDSQPSPTTMRSCSIKQRTSW